MPIFSIYTFSGEKIGPKTYLVVSKKWTIVNIIITLLGITAGVIYIYFFGYHSTTYIAALTISLPLIFISLISYLFLILCKSCCCKNLIKRSGLDLENLNIVDIDDPTINERNDLELEPKCLNPSLEL